MEQDEDDLEEFSDIDELMHELQLRDARIEELEDTIAEFQDFLQQNPDVKEVHGLRSELIARSRRIQELENWIKKWTERSTKIDKERILELEEMVTHLEEYVKEHNVDVLKHKLRDREDRLEQLKKRLSSVEDNGCKQSIIMQNENVESSFVNDMQSESSVRKMLLEREQKMKEMEHDLSEKDNKVQEYEQQIAEWKDKSSKYQSEVKLLTEKLHDIKRTDLEVLRDQIRIKDDRLQQLEAEMESLERVFKERVDLEQIHELVNLVKEKEKREQELENEVQEKGSRIEELTEALRQSVILSTESERKIQLLEDKNERHLDKMEKLENRITAMGNSSALTCSTCTSLLKKLHKAEKKLENVLVERRERLKDFHQMKREALKVAVSEKDAQLALLELSGVKTTAETSKVEKVRSDRKKLLGRLKEEDNRCIELTRDSSSSSSECIPVSDDADSCKDDDMDSDKATAELVEEQIKTTIGRDRSAKTSNCRPSGGKLQSNKSR